MVLLQGVIDLETKFSDADFIDFWQRYCYIYNAMFKKKDAIGTISTTFDGELGLLVGEEIEVEETGEPGDGEDTPQKPGKPGKKTGIAGIFDTLAKMNANEQEREQEMQFWLAQTEELYSFLKSEGKFMAMLRSDNFTREQIEKEYNKLIRRYFRQTEDVKVKKLIDENKEMFLEEFKTEVLKPKVSSMKPYTIVEGDYLSMVAEPNL